MSNNKLSRQELSAALNQELDNLANQVTTERVTDALGYTPAKASDITWSNVLSKPDAFAPSTHTHSYNDLTDKPVITALNNTLTSTATNLGLTAAQGKVLNDLITAHTGNKANPHGVTTTQVNHLTEYSKKITDTALSYPLGLSSTFVRAAEGGGWPHYGTVLTARSFGTAGATLQLYTPYSDALGGTLLKYRIWKYQATDWSEWYSLETTAGAQAKVDAHAADTTLHVTGAERTAWNAKAGATLATTSADGLMSSADKTKLEGIAPGANNYTYTLPTATASVLGGVRTSTNITNASGVISVANASTSARGVVQLNNTLTSTSTSEATTAAQAKTLNDNAVAHASTIASTTQLGHVKVDGTTITVDANGVIKSAGSSSGGNIQEHVTANAPHQYGGRFEWRFNPTTNSLDLVVL